MQFSHGVSLFGRYTITKTGRDGSVRQRLAFDNVVLNVGVDSYIYFNTPSGGSGDQLWWVARYLFLGTGTTAEQATDAGLENRSGTLAGKAGSLISYDHITSTPVGSTGTIRYVYGEGEAEGVWTEMGSSNDSSYNLPFNRTLIKDDQGAPISLTVLSDEFLTVEYTLNIMDNLAGPVTGSIMVNGVSAGYTMEAFVDSYGRWASPSNSRFLIAEWGVGQAIALSNDGNLTYNGPDWNNWPVSWDDTNKLFTLNKVIDPGSSVTYQYIYIGLKDITSVSYPTYTAYLVTLDSPITKTADEKMTIQISVSPGGVPL